jgi:4-amino-4-deoxy-L-arabinose transferase-like glycosyltransferase
VAEREWREAVDMRSSTWAIGAVIAVALVLRFWNLSHGVPFAVGVDEPEIMERVVRMMRTGDFNPHFFDYPGLYFYVQLAVACVRFLAGATSGAWYELDDVSTGDFYTWARAVTALLGTATVVLVYLCGMRWGSRHALLGAGLLAVMPLHVRESHYVLTDVPMTFFVTLTLLLSLRASEKGSVATFALAGATAGLAAATKYNGLIALVMPLSAAWIAAPSDNGGRASRLLAAAAAAGAAFLVAAPYTVLDLPAFLNAYAGLAKHYKPPARMTEAAWITYLKYLRGTMAWPALLLAGTGLVLAMVRAFTGPLHVRFVLLTGFPIVYFYLISTRSLVFGRYLLPVLPFTSLLAAIAVVSGVSLLRRFDFPRNVRTALIAAGTVAAVLPPLVMSIGFDRLIGRETTQGRAYTWIRAHVPPGSRVVVEGRVVQLPDHDFKVEHVRSLTDRDIAEYRQGGIEYAVASSSQYGVAMQAPHAQPALYARYRSLFDQSQELIVVKPTEDASGPEVRVLKLTPDQPPTSSATRPEGPLRGR